MMAFLVVLATATIRAQSVYSNAVMSLGPVGYWPMHESESTVYADIETNYGTLGALETGAYGDWETLGNTKIVHGQQGCITNDQSERSVFFSFINPSASTGSFTNGLIIPRTSPFVSLVPPFSVECWNYGLAGSHQADIWGQGGYSGFNGGANYAGIRLHWDNTGWNVYGYNGVGSTLNTIIQYNPGSGPGPIPVNNVWYHTVVSDDGTNIMLWINGTNVAKAASVGNYVADTFDPLCIDAGTGGGTEFDDSFYGFIDEFAVYTNALSQNVITNHYFIGTNGTASAYYNAVISANPVVYYQMNSPGLVADPAGYPMNNYGSAGINGVYRPEVLPGGVNGPGVFSAGFTGTNAMPGNGGSGFADVGSSTAYNPTGASTNFTITAWFKGNPTDARIQSIVGHGTNSWELGLTKSGTVVFNSGTNNTTSAGGTSAGDLVSPGVYNDGFWHFVAAVHSITTNALYMDGVLVATNIDTASIPGSSGDMLIGADPAFTNNPSGYGRQFAGDVCEVAYFATNLSAGVIQTLFNDSEMAPVITSPTQPATVTVAAGGGFTTNVTVLGVGPFSYQWYSNGMAMANGGNISGTTTNVLTINPVGPVNADNYYAVVQNSYGSSTSAVVTLVVAATAAIGAEFPMTQTNLFNMNYLTLYAGASPNFSISASGALPLFYYWFTNGVLDGVATNAGMTLPNVKIGAFNTYCIVSNSVSTATSAVWSASVVADPTNAFGAVAPYPQAVLSLNPIAYWRLNEADNGNDNEAVIAHDYASGNNGLYTNVVLGNSGQPLQYNVQSDPSDTSMGVGGVGNSSNSFSFCGFIGTNIDLSAPSGSNDEYTVECWANVTAQQGGIVQKGYDNGGEECILDTIGPDKAFRYLIRPANASVQWQITDSTVPNGSSWYQLVAVCDEANSNLSLYVNGVLDYSSNSASLHNAGIVADVAANLTIGAESGTASSGPNVQSQGYINDVAVFNYALTPQQIFNEYNQSGIPPYFTQQPAAITYVAKGGNVTNNTAVVAGTSPLAYQWYETNLMNATSFLLPGQTNAALILNNVTTNDNYFLNVTNGYSYSSTNSAVIAVVPYSYPLIIKALPVPYTNLFTLYAGTSPAFSVSAFGTTALSYYWSTNGVNVTGASASNLTLANLQVGFLTNECIVSNSLGTASNVWVAQIIPIPSAPYPQAVMALNPIGYWRMNDIILNGADNGDGDNGWVCHDYAGGNDGVYTNVSLGNTGYNPTTDPSDTSVNVGGDPDNESGDNGDQDANSIAGINFSAPSGASVAFTVEAWVNGGVNEPAGAGIVTLGYGNGGEQFDMDCGGGGTNALRFFIRSASGASDGVNSAILCNNTWQHLVGVVDEINNHNVTFYINGVPVGTAAVAAGSGNLLSSNLMSIGARTGSATSNYNLQFSGNINDVAIFNYALSPLQVENQYLVGGGTNAPYFVPAPPTNGSAAANTTLTIPVTVLGSSSVGYWWTNVTTGAGIASGVANNTSGDATLNYANVPLSWNTNQLELTVTNGYGSTNVFFTLSIINGSPTNIVFAVTNSLLYLSWPQDHIGWQLQTQTNKVSVGLGTNWANYNPSTGTNLVAIPINLTNGTVFYRLIYSP